jgi:RNA polymerase sigma-70 factor (ECF subfamily)
MDTPASLLQRLRQATQPEAWKRFVDLYTPILFAFAGRLGLQEADAADLVQDTLLLLLRKLPAFSYDARRSFRAWLWTIMRHQVLEAQRRMHVKTLNLAELAAVPDQLDEHWEKEYRERLIGRALEIMKNDFQPATWKACWEHAVSGRAAADVARELGMTVGAVYAAKFRVLARLRQELEGFLE